MADYLPLTALKVFEATARHGSFSKAAEELHVTPGAVSQQIKTLEDLLGVRLFHRLHRRLELTEAARAGLDSLAEGFARLGEAVTLIRAGGGERELRIWTPPSFAARWLVPRLGDFTRAHPDIEIGISASVEMIGTGHSVELTAAERFSQSDIDIGIFFGRGEYADCRADLLLPGCLVPLCSPALIEGHEHPLRKPEDLAHHRLLHDDTAYEGRIDWEGWLEEAGIDGIETDHGLRFNQVTLALKAATDGQGVVLSNKHLAQADIEAGRLVIPFGPEIELQHAFYVISLADRADEPRIKTFREWILEAGRRHRQKQSKGKRVKAVKAG